MEAVLYLLHPHVVGEEHGHEPVRVVESTLPPVPSTPLQVHQGPPVAVLRALTDLSRVDRRERKPINRRTSPSPARKTDVTSLVFPPFAHIQYKSK